MRPCPGQPGAISSPPLAADAAVHTGTVPSSGQRCATATAAPAIADTAAATGPAAAAGITGSGLVRASSTVKNARTSSARAANRRSHPRTVDAGRPSTAAIVRCPAPAAAASSAAPITAPASARRDRAQRRELAQVELARLVGRYPGDYRGAFGQHMCEGGIGGQDGCSRAPPVLR